MANSLHTNIVNFQLFMCALSKANRYLTKTVFAFFCSICPPFYFYCPLPPHTHRYTHLHTYTHTNSSHTHTFHFALKQVGPRNAYSVGYLKILVPKTRICSFSPSLQVSLPKYPVGRNGKEWGRKERKSWYKFPASAVQAVRNRRPCSSCAGISPAILLKLRGAFLSAAPTLPPSAKASCCDRTRGWWVGGEGNAAR